MSFLFFELRICLYIGMGNSWNVGLSREPFNSSSYSIEHYKLVRIWPLDCTITDVCCEGNIDIYSDKSFMSNDGSPFMDSFLGEFHEIRFAGSVRDYKAIIKTIKHLSKNKSS